MSWKTIFKYIQKLLNDISLLKEKINSLQVELNQYKNRNSHNSSLPPSQDFKKNCPKNNSGGAKPGHRAHQRKMLPEDKVDQTEICCSSQCPKCNNQNIRPTNRTSIFQYIDLVEGKVYVINYERKGYYCSCCRKYFLASIPNKIGKSPFGPNIQAAICTLTARFHLSKRECSHLFQDLFKLHISYGIVSKIEAATAKKLAPYYTEIRKEILKSNEPIYADETRWRHAGQNSYIWEMSTKTRTLYQVHFHRNKKARDTLLGDRFRKPLVTDRYCVYKSLNVPHQYCLAHLLRNFQKISEYPSIPGVIGRGLIKEMKSIFRLWRLYREDKITHDKLKQKCYYRRKVIKDWLKEGVFSKNKRFSRFCWKLLGEYDRMWTFLRVPNMDPTNNQAERDLRPMVLWRKKSLGTQGTSGLYFVSIVGSVVQTLRKQGRSIYTFISEVLENSQNPLIQNL